MAKFSRNLTYAKIERNKMLYSIDVNGYRSKRTITHLTDDTEAALSKITSENDVIITQEGDIASINDSFKRMSKAIALGIVLLLVGLIAIYKSVKMALIMILVLPLSMIGAAWGM